MGESSWYEKGRGTFGLKPTADFDFMKKISAEVASKAGIELRKVDIAGSKKVEQSAEDFVQQTKINTARDSEMKKKDTTAQAFESRNRSYLPKSATSSRRGSSFLSNARGKSR
jgi:hypothetical protein